MPAAPIDEEDLQRRAAEAVPSAEIGPVTRLQGGTSSVTYWATYRGPEPGLDRVVLKVAPAGLMPTKNRDVLRQARVQTALQGTDVPCPRVLGSHPGEPPEVPPFYVMAFEPGDCVEPNFLPPDERLPAGEVEARELDAARILGRLHALDPGAVGLGDEPTVSPDQELERWFDSFEACDEDLRAGHREVHDGLAAAVPASVGSTVIHGDYRLGNTLSEGDGVTSVIDWEIWARADPRVDLAWYLMMCNPDEALGRPRCEGMPGNDALLDAYQASRGTQVVDAGWFDALVRYKQAAVVALIVRNARKRGEEPPVGTTHALLASATKLLAGS
jgi:aminoglycoside phosphotransferase (APT) family kinase protein